MTIIGNLFLLPEASDGIFALYTIPPIPKEPALIPSYKSAPCQNCDAPHKKTTDNSCTGNAPKNA